MDLEQVFKWCDDDQDRKPLPKDLVRSYGTVSATISRFSCSVLWHGICNYEPILLFGLMARYLQL
jgi:hypothetical protein